MGVPIMGIERIRRRNRMLIQRGDIPGALSTPQTTPTKPIVVRGGILPLPCIHEGAILEHCHSRHGGLAEARHVRDCDIYEKCTRGFVSNRVTWCGRCPDYKAEETAESEPSPSQQVKTCGVPSSVEIIPLDIPSQQTDEDISMDLLPEDQRLQKKPKRTPVWLNFIGYS